jgi:multidrug efflux pump
MPGLRPTTCARDHQRQSAGPGRHLRRRPPERDHRRINGRCAPRPNSATSGGQELNGNFVRLSDVAEVEDSVRNSRSIAWFNKQPAVLIQITKQGDANVIETVDRVRALIPDSSAGSRPASRFRSCRPHRHHPRQRLRTCSWTLLATIVPGDAGGVRVPAPDDADDRRRRHGAAGAGRHLRRLMWLAGFLDRQSVADGAGDLGRLRGRRRHRHDREHVPQSREGHGAVCGGARGRAQIGFTVLSISLSLIAAFTPLMFMDGIVGRLLREFSLTLTFAIVVSTVVSLTSRR